MVNVRKTNFKMAGELFHISTVCNVQIVKTLVSCTRILARTPPDFMPTKIVLPDEWDALSFLHTKVYGDVQDSGNYM